MPSSRQLSDLRSDVRQYADMENSGLAADAEVTRRINESIARLWDLLVDARGIEYAITTATVDTTAGEPTVDIATGIYKLLAVHWSPETVDDPIDRYKCLPGTLDDVLEDSNRNGWSAGTQVRFTIADMSEAQPQLRFHPIPQGVHRVIYYYVPEAPSLTDDTDLLYLPNRWHSWVTLDVAIQLLAKEETDASQLILERERVERSIRDSATSIDHYEPPRIRDVRGRFGMADRERWDWRTRRG